MIMVIPVSWALVLIAMAAVIGLVSGYMWGRDEP